MKYLKINISKFINFLIWLFYFFKYFADYYQTYTDKIYLHLRTKHKIIIKGTA